MKLRDALNALFYNHVSVRVHSGEVDATYEIGDVERMLYAIDIVDQIDPGILDFVVIDIVARGRHNVRVDVYNPTPDRT